MHEPTPPPHASSPQPHLQRRLGLVQATALNMVNMVGVGPFMTIPLLMTAMGGPQAMLGWVVAVLICLPDSLVWSELGAAMPGSGGSYVYLREGFGRHTWGRLMAFLFIWQFVFSGPLEIASGYIGFGKYASYVWDASTLQKSLMAAGVGLINIIVLFRGIRSIGKLTVFLWIGMLVTVTCVIVTGMSRFDSRVAFDYPPGWSTFSWGFFWGLGQAARIGIYDYLGYYDVCFLGEEVRDPGRVIPRSVIMSLLGVATIYVLMNLSIIGSIPWREFVGTDAVPVDQNPKANYIVSILMENVHGRRVALAFTALILLTTYASTFALLLGYSRIPYAAAKDGYFFRAFAELHPTKSFPYVSLLAVGFLSIAACFVELGIVIDALIACRILVLFIGQIGALMLLRRRAPQMHRPFRMWLYPVPCFIALAGWVFVYATSGGWIILFSLAVLVAGVLAFLWWSKATRRWPFAPPEVDSGQPAFGCPVGAADAADHRL
ncbi:MAG: amino acid permease [Phycisphaerae bacterium]